MAVLKRRLARKNDSGVYETMHLETSSDLVLRPDGTTVEAFISNLKLDSSGGYPLLEVRTSDPASPKTGQMWLVKG